MKKKKNVNPQESCKMYSSFSDGEKIVAVSDIKLNNMLINGSKIQCTEVYSSRFQANKVNRENHQYKIKKRAISTCKQRVQNGFLLFENIAINRLLQIQNQISLNSNVQQLMIMDCQAVQPSSNPLTTQNKISRHKCFKAINNIQEAKNNKKTIPKCKNHLINNIKQDNQQKNKNRVKNLFDRFHKRLFNKDYYAKSIRLLKKIELNASKFNTPLLRMEKGNADTHSIKNNSSYQFTTEILMPVLTPLKQRRKTFNSQRTTHSQH